MRAMVLQQPRSPLVLIEVPTPKAQGSEVLISEESFCFKLPQRGESVEWAPLLCAGLIGYRSYRAAGKGKRLGFYGFGAAAHILTQLAVCQGREVHAFTRPGDSQTQSFAKSLGATWVGGSDQLPPQELDAAILFAPIGALVPEALKAIKKGGKEPSKNKMNNLTSAKSPKINDRKWGCITMNTTPFPIVDFRLIWRGEIVHFILRRFLK